MSTSSTNIGKSRNERGLFPERQGLRLVDGFDADDPAVRAVVGELHAAGDLGEQGVILPAADVQARAEPATALTHENRAARHDVAVETLDSQPLRIAVAAVA